MRLVIVCVKKFQINFDNGMNGNIYFVDSGQFGYSLKGAYSTSSSYSYFYDVIIGDTRPEVVLVLDFVRPYS